MTIFSPAVAPNLPLAPTPTTLVKSGDHQNKEKMKKDPVKFTDMKDNVIRAIWRFL